MTTIPLGTASMLVFVILVIVGCFIYSKYSDM